ncbi:MAG: 2-oxoacid:acceptor oxidoreductase family protein, partial [Halobaculum sp.]
RVEENDWHVFDIDLRSMAREQGREVMRNTAGVGVTGAIAGIDLSYIEDLMEDAMPEKILEPNLEILELGYEKATEEFDVDAPDVQVPEGEHEEEQVLMS